MPPLTFPEVRRGAVALSSLYVERRGGGRIASRSVDGAGKRAAFATYFAPLHFLTLYHAIEPGWLEPAPRRIVDLGCGTGAAAAAMVARLPAPPEVVALDRSGWALGEARHTLRAFGAPVRTRRGRLPEAWPSTRPGDLIVLGWVVNECGEGEPALLERARRALDAGARVLVAEPLAHAVAPWWSRWMEALAGSGVRAVETRGTRELPPLLAKLDRAAGLDHATLGARLLFGPA